MIRTVLAIAACVIIPQCALADTIPIVPGALTVHQGDVIVTSKPLLDKPNAAGFMVHNPPSQWRDYASLGWFTLSGGATTLKPLSPLKGPYVKNGYSYQVMDGTPVVVAPPVVVQPVAPAGPLYGINLSGGEFKGMSNGAFLPTVADMDAYYAAGYRMFRIPVVMGELDNSAPKLVALGNECIKLAAPCVFENHSYTEPTIADGIAQVVKTYTVLPKSPFVQWGVANEPNTKVSDTWATDTQGIVTGARAAGVTMRLWFDFGGSSGVYHFDKGDVPPKCTTAACSMMKLPGGTIVDPLKLTGLDAHEYFDSNGSGTSATCAPYVNLKTFATQAARFGLPVMLGETALGNSETGVPASCTVAAAELMAEIKIAPNLYGVTWWGGGYKLGQVWGNYQFRALPVATSPYIQMTTGK